MKQFRVIYWVRDNCRYKVTARFRDYEEALTAAKELVASSGGPAEILRLVTTVNGQGGYNVLPCCTTGDKGGYNVLPCRTTGDSGLP